MSWWNLIKNAKLSSKAKLGGKLKDGDVKINFDKDDCIKRLKRIVEWGATVETNYENERLGMGSDKHIKHVHSFIDGLGEQTVCKILQFLDSYDLQDALDDYLTMKEVELFATTVANKWVQNTGTDKRKFIDKNIVNIYLDAGKATSEEYWDIRFNMEIVSRNDFIKIYEISMMKTNPKTNKRYMHFIDDWRKRG
jgi:hypothetical protein